MATATDNPSHHPVPPDRPAPDNTAARKPYGGGWPRRVGWTVLALLLSIVGIVAVCEGMGWPFLRQPLQNFLTKTLQREVSFDTPSGSPEPVGGAFSVHLLGGIELRLGNLRVAAPAWSQAPHLLQAQGVVLNVRYTDLWAAHEGKSVRLRRLEAAGLDAQLERLADGRASWQFGKPDEPHDTPPPTVGNLQVASGAIRYRDEPRAIDVTVKLSLTEGPPPGTDPQALAATEPASAPGSAPTVVASASAPGVAASRGGALAASAPVVASANVPPPATTTAQAQMLTLRAHAGGRYRDLPLQVALTTSGALPWLADDAVVSAQKAPLRISASVGRATLAFDGTATDLRHLRDVNGQFTITGPSLAAVGDTVGVTLPTTAAFRARGWVVKQGDVWNVVADDATVGTSKLNGAFTYDRGRAKPLLSGRLGGSRLMLADLGPALGGGTPRATGGVPAATAASAAAPAAPASAMASTASTASTASAPVTTGKARVAAVSAALKNSLDKGPPPKVVKAPGKLLPNRPFDLPALNRMDANVMINIGELDLNTALLEPLRPIRTHLVLMNGVLTLNDLDARTAQGRLQGFVRLDGRAQQALWTADLRVANVRLEQWLHLKRANPEAPPYITGVLNGRAKVTGKGRSTADMLATLDGQVHGELTNGSISHLLVEMAGLDLAQGLGLLIKGDDALPVSCGVADLVAKDGQLRPRVMVVDTRDSTIWVDGTLSLAQESMDLRAVVSPKDFSPLTLRTPLLVKGSLSNPDVSIQKAPLARKAGSALLLGLLNPIASLLALLDPGDGAAAQQDAQGCRALAQRGTAASKR